MSVLVLMHTHERTREYTRVHAASACLFTEVVVFGRCLRGARVLSVVRRLEVVRISEVVECMLRPVGGRQLSVLRRLSASRSVRYRRFHCIRKNHAARYMTFPPLGLHSSGVLVWEINVNCTINSLSCE